MRYPCYSLNFLREVRCRAIRLIAVYVLFMVVVISLYHHPVLFPVQLIMSLKRLSPDTATLECSIWKGIDRKKFDVWNNSICRKGHVPGRRLYPAGVEKDGNVPCLQVEKSLADDLAFISACEPMVEYVSAVALEQHQSGSRILVKLAANEGVSVRVSNAFDNIFQVLRKHAMKGKEPNFWRIM